MRWRMVFVAVLATSLLLGAGVRHYTVILPLPPMAKRIDCSIFQISHRGEVNKASGRDDAVFYNRSIAADHDLSEHEQLALSGTDDQGLAQTHGQARSYLWQQWQARRRTYLRLTSSSVEETTTTHFFIEPDELGTWRVVGKVLHQCCQIDDIPGMYAMRWVTRSRTPLPEGQKPDPARDLLELRGVCGTEHLL